MLHHFLLSRGIFFSLSLSSFWCAGPFKSSMHFWKTKTPNLSLLNLLSHKYLKEWYLREIENDTFSLIFEDEMIHPPPSILPKEIPSSFSLARALKCKKLIKHLFLWDNVIWVQRMYTALQNCCLVSVIRPWLSFYVWFQENQICFYVHYDYN